MHLGCLILGHDLQLGDELGSSHQHDHDRGDHNHENVAFGAVDSKVKRSAPEFSGAERLRKLGVQKANAGRVRSRLVLCVLKHREQAEEYRHLQQQWQAGTKRVGACLLVQVHGFARHRLAGELVFLPLVLVLDLLELRRDLQGAALALDLLHEQRNQCGSNHQNQPDDRQHPSESIVRIHPQRGDDRVEGHQDRFNGPFDRPENNSKDIHASGLTLSLALY